MATLTTIEKAPILNEAGVQLIPSAYTAVSADTSIATVLNQSTKLWVAGIAPGSTTITATRIADGSTATADVTVVAPAVPFAITIGVPVPK